MPKAPPRNQKTQPKNRQPSKSLVEVDNYNHEANALVLAEKQGITLKQAHKALADDAKTRLRGQRHDVTTNKGVVALLNEAINGFLLDPDGTIIGRSELNTLGYVAGIQLRAIEAVQKEEQPADSLQALLGAGGSVEIKMTREERKLFLTAGTPEKMARIIQEVHNDGRIIELEADADGTFAVPPLAEPPRGDAKMPITELTRALRAEETDITRAEVGKIFGNALGSSNNAEDLETFGFDALLNVEPKKEPGLQHDWEQATFEHPNLPGIVVRVSKCTRCGITTKNTQNHTNEMCGAE